MLMPSANLIPAGNRPTLLCNGSSRPRIYSRVDNDKLRHISTPSRGKLNQADATFRTKMSHIIRLASPTHTEQSTQPTCLKRITPTQATTSHSATTSSNKKNKKRAHSTFEIFDECADHNHIIDGTPRSPQPPFPAPKPPPPTPFCPDQTPARPHRRTYPCSLPPPLPPLRPIGHANCTPWNGITLTSSENSLIRHRKTGPVRAHVSNSFCVSTSS